MAMTLLGLLCHYRQPLEDFALAKLLDFERWVHPDWEQWNHDPEPEPPPPPPPEDAEVIAARAHKELLELQEKRAKELDAALVKAQEVAKATGTAFGNDTVGRILGKYDKDGNGTFDITECVPPPCALASLCFVADGVRCAPCAGCATLYMT